MTLRCALCAIDDKRRAEGKDVPGHVHLLGDIPLTPCPACLEHHREPCNATDFYCTCSICLRDFIRGRS